MGASLVGGGAGVTVNVDRTVAAGTHIENEPIIKSDGAGSVMQWDNSNADAGEGIYFVEGGSAGDPLRLGIGVAAPAVGLDVHHNTEISAGFGRADDGTNYISVRTAETQNNIAGLAFMVGSTTQTGVGSSYQMGGVQSKVVNDGGTLKGSLSFLTNSGDSIATRMTVDEDGLVSVGAQSFTPHADADDFVIKPAVTSTGITIRCNGDGGTGSIFFADTSSNAVGQIRYNHNTDDLTLTAADDIVFSCDAVTLPSTVTIGSLDIGHGANGNAESTAVGDGALNSNASATTAIRNTAIGHDALTALNHNDADHNTAVGYNAGDGLLSGYQNT